MYNGSSDGKWWSLLLCVSVSIVLSWERDCPHTMWSDWLSHLCRCCILSSTNFRMTFSLSKATRSWVNRVWRIGLRSVRSVWNARVSHYPGWCCLPNKLGPASQKIHESVTEAVVQTKSRQFVSDFVGNYCLIWRAVIHVEGIEKDSSDSVWCGPGQGFVHLNHHWPISELVILEDACMLYHWWICQFWFSLTNAKWSAQSWAMSYKENHPDTTSSSHQQWKHWKNARLVRNSSDWMSRGKWQVATTKKTKKKHFFTRFV